MGDDGFEEFRGNLNALLKNVFHTVQVPEEQNNLRTVFVVAGIIALILAALLVNAVVQGVLALRSQKRQKERFQATLSQVKNIQRTNAAVQSKASQEVPQLPEHETINRAELEELAAQCERLGTTIDRHTDRRHNSKNVSELVFKVSTALGLHEGLSTLYFCAAMVYDAGFLDIPGELFRAEILSAGERKALRTHVMRAGSYLNFVPAKYAGIFLEAAMLHHENVNGSGYPEGLKGTEIPQLARILHVVESYVSLTSRRSYRKTFSREAAVAELRRQPGIYDTDIVDVLEKQV